MKWLKLYLEFNSSYNPIGVFDSGYGGLFILTTLRKKFPDYDFVFLGDNLTAPYGELDSQEIVSLTTRGLDFLNQSGCKTNIVACNTACSLSTYSSNTIDIITPTIDWVKRVKYDHLGVLGTSKTIHLGVYQKSLDRVTALSCPNWAQLVENGEFNTSEGLEIIKSDLSELFNLNNDIDTILLACTHYVILKDIIKELYPDIKIISQDDIIVDYISALGIEPSLGGTCKYFTTGSSDEFDRESLQLIGQKINSQRVTI